MADFDYNGVDYMPWPSTNAMSHSLIELYRYGKNAVYQRGFPNLCAALQPVERDRAQNAAAHPAQHPGDLGACTCARRAWTPWCRSLTRADGAINVPRITSGFETDEYMDFVAAQELLLHGVFSHFIHPDDILDTKRSKNLSWAEMFNLFEERIDQIAETYPDLRYLTASEGAGAVQRFSRVGVQREEDDRGLTLTLSNFFDEGMACAAHAGGSGVRHRRRAY